MVLLVQCMHPNYTKKNPARNGRETSVLCNEVINSKAVISLCVCARAHLDPYSKPTIGKEGKKVATEAQQSPAYRDGSERLVIQWRKGSTNHCRPWEYGHHFPPPSCCGKSFPRSFVLHEVLQTESSDENFKPPYGAKFYTPPPPPTPENTLLGVGGV